MNEMIWSIFAAILFGVSPLFMKSGVKKTAPYLSATIWVTVSFLVSCVSMAGVNWENQFSNMNGRIFLWIMVSALCLSGAVIFFFKALKNGTVMGTVAIMACNYYLMVIVQSIFDRVWPGIPRVVLLVLVIISVVMMTISKGKNSRNQWLFSSILAVCFLVAERMLYSRYVGFAYKGTILMFLAMIICWIVTFATGSVKAIRSLSFIDGLFLILSPLVIYFAFYIAPGAQEQMVLLGSIIATAVLACGFYKERMTNTYFAGMILFEFISFWWLGYLPFLSGIL